MDKKKRNEGCADN